MVPRVDGGGVKGILIGSAYQSNCELHYRVSVGFEKMLSTEIILLMPLALA